MGKDRSLPKRMPIFFISYAFKLTGRNCRDARVYAGITGSFKFIFSHRINKNYFDRHCFPIFIELLIFERMHPQSVPAVLFEHILFHSDFLKRNVDVDFYLPGTDLPVHAGYSLLLINDGQDMIDLGLKPMLQTMFAERRLGPLLCIGLHASKDRKMEYGTAGRADYMGRGARAGAYTSFIMKELLPFVYRKFGVPGFREKAFAGFSLGGLMALDIVWNHPQEFTKTGVFSGSLWWRSRGLTHGYVEETDRIIHQEIKKGAFYPGLKFYFTTGSLDETADRNHNGIIDSIDDTLSLIDELVRKGYQTGGDIVYRNFEDGKHDVATWGRAMPEFLQWGWGL